MSCQQATRVQEDPYAFTEPAPLQTNTSLYKHAHATSTSSSSSSSSTTPSPVIQAGTSLLTTNQNTGSNHHAVQNRMSAVASPKVAPIKVTLMQPTTAAATLAKSRLNGAITTSPSGGTAVFRTVSVPQATTIVQQRPAGSVVATSITASSPTTTTTTTTVFTKPLQVQISPQQAGGKFSRRVLANKSPNVSPAAATSAGTIQTLRIVKSASPQQPVGGRPTITPDARRYLNHSSNQSLLGPPPATTTVAPPVPVPIQSVSPTKIRLIQPQPQGKIFLHTPNSSNSLAAATHISNPASIAALRNTLARQNPSLLNKIPNSSVVPSQPQPTVAPQLSSVASSSTVLPTPMAKTTASTTAAMTIRRTSPPITSQTSLETATTTVPAPPPPPPAASIPPTILPSTTPIVPRVPLQRSKTPTTSILKPQPPPQILQDDNGFTIPSFIISKKELQADQTTSLQSPSPVAAGTSPPATPIHQPISTSTPSSSSATTTTTPKTTHGGTRGRPPLGTERKTPGTGKRTKRSYSRSSHHETLERISTPAGAGPSSQTVKTEEDHPQNSSEPAAGGKPPDAKPPIRFVKYKPPGALAIPMNREWHAPDSWVFDISGPGVSASPGGSLSRSPLTLEHWFEERYASSELDPETIPGIGMRPRKAVGRKASGEEQQNKQQLLLLNLNADGDRRGDGDHDLKALSRDERLELKRAQLRRKAVQYWNGQGLRSILPARKRVRDTGRLLSKMNHQRELMLKRNGGAEQPKCQRAGCNQVALLATNHCYQHITDNTEQRLFQQCTAKFSDNSQCRVPVFDISHELILCREHAWKHDNHDKMSAEGKLQKKPVGGAAGKKKVSKSAVPATVAVVSAARTVPAAAPANVKKKSKKKKLTPFQQQMALHQQQYKQQYSSINHSKPTLPPPPYGTVSAGASIIQTAVPKTTLPAAAAVNTVRQAGSSLLQQSQQQQQQHIRYHQPNTVVTPGTGAGTGAGGLVQIVPPQSAISRNVHIPLSQQQQQQRQQLSFANITTYQQQQPQQITQTSTQHQLIQPQQPPQNQHIIGRNEDLMLNYAVQQQQQQQHQFSQQHVQQMLGHGATTQDLLNICENSSAYASSEDTGVGGLSESELMAAQDVIEEIPFEIGNLNNVLSQLPADAFNELLFSEQEQHAPAFESTQQEEEDLERALEVVGEHVKSLEDMTVESANFLGDFLDNVDDEMLDGSDICSDQMLQSPSTNDIRGLVHT